jgi:hypothetical protein
MTQQRYDFLKGKLEAIEDLNDGAHFAAACDICGSCDKYIEYLEFEKKIEVGR